MALENEDLVYVPASRVNVEILMVYSESTVKH